MIHFVSNRFNVLLFWKGAAPSWPMHHGYSPLYVHCHLAKWTRPKAVEQRGGIRQASCWWFLKVHGSEKCETLTCGQFPSSALCYRRSAEFCLFQESFARLTKDKFSGDKSRGAVGGWGFTKNVRTKINQQICELFTNWFWYSIVYGAKFNR